MSKHLISICNEQIKRYERMLEQKKQRQLELDMQIDVCVTLITKYQNRKEEIERGEL